MLCPVHITFGVAVIYMYASHPVQVPMGIWPANQVCGVVIVGGVGVVPMKFTEM